MATKNCYSCQKAINLEKEKYVLLGTYNGTGKSKKNEDYFHFQCWIDYFNQQIVRRIQLGQNSAMKMLQGALGNIKMGI